MRPDISRILDSLKDFQRSTVDYTLRRLWLDDDWVKRFLVADEVGLGKTMVAKGVIAKTVDHLWETDKRIDIVCRRSPEQVTDLNQRFMMIDASQTTTETSDETGIAIGG